MEQILAERSDAKERSREERLSAKDRKSTKAVLLFHGTENVASCWNDAVFTRDLGGTHGAELDRRCSL